MTIATGLRAQLPDTAALLKKARRGETAYETSIRRFAPMRESASDGRRCDETVGRFCVIYDTGQEDLPAEPVRVRIARDSAIAVLQRASGHLAGDSRIAFPLVRLLVVAGKATDALEAARAYARLSPTADAHMLLGYALHADRQTEKALGEFETWLGSLSEGQRTRVVDIKPLLTDPERRRFERMTPAARDSFAQRAWRFADPLYLTPGNELLADHYARHALARILATRPAAIGNERWGDDVAELMIRFGAPVRTTRHYPTGSLTPTPVFSEFWDPAERTYFPPASSAELIPARVDTIWPIDSLTTRSGHAPPTVRLMRVLEHQASRISGNHLLVVGSAQFDSVAKGRAHVLGRLFALDSLFQVMASADAQVRALDDSVTFRAELSLPAGASFYSAEMLDTTTLLAARARYPLPAIENMPPLSMSGLLLCESFQPGELPISHHDPRLRPLSRPVVVTGAPFGVYGEISSLAGARRTVKVELETRALGRRWIGARVSGWIGSKLRGSPAQSAKLGWVVEVEPGKPTPFALTIEPGELPPGRYQVVVKAEDSAAAAAVSAIREFVVTSGGRADSVRR